MGRDYCGSERDDARERGRPGAGGGRVGGGEESLRTLPVRDALQSSWELNQSKITDSFGQDRRGEEGSEQKLLPTNVTAGSSHLIVSVSVPISFRRADSDSSQSGADRASDMTYVPSRGRRDNSSTCPAMAGMSLGGGRSSGVGVALVLGVGKWPI